KFMWPGFGDNMRVLEWMLKRVTGQAQANETPIGYLPKADDLNLEGLNIDSATLSQLLDVNKEAWYEEMEAIGEYLQSYGDRTPKALMDQQQKIAKQLA
ncbi:MAG: phosphoenolpyruvate carboxykinase domain-containing protein, partial [Arenimonas sp.]